MVLHMNLPQNGYDIVIERGILQKVGTYLDLNRKVLIVTDRGVPAAYAQAVAEASAKPFVVTVPQGEESKSVFVWEQLCKTLLRENFTRSDCVLAVGGGVVGDLAGFVAASYMRGIDFYNLPTTVLSQVDSSIGGKVAVNLDGIKNIVGAFYQPKKVLIDPNVLDTLPQRQIANGLAEAVKMALTSDAELFAAFEQEDVWERIEWIIARSLMIKKQVVEQDEKETGARRILNFGHTLGHGIEAELHLNGLYHGECVALGMLPMCAPQVRTRLFPVLRKLHLPTELQADPESVLANVVHDKKCDGTDVTVVWVDRIGSCECKKMPLESWKDLVRSTWNVGGLA